MNRLFFVLLLFSCSTVSAQGCGTLVYPGLEPPSPWTAQGSPYCVPGGNLNIGFPLTIGPGVEVRVKGNFKITMAAPLTVSGPVVFRADRPTTTSWQGLVLTVAGNNVHGLRVEDATDSGLQLRLGAVATVLDSCVLIDNEAPRGGGLSIDLAPGLSGAVSLRKCQILRNRATSDHGGGLYASLDLATLNIEDSFISDNSARAHGGGLSIVVVGTGNRVGLTNTVIERNRTDTVSGATGGGARIVGAADLARCIVRANATSSPCYEHTATGGGLWLSGDATLVASQFIGNSVASCGSLSGAYGGGVYLGSQSGAVLISNSLFAGNRTQGGYSRGAGVNANAGTVQIEQCTFANNEEGGSNLLGAVHGETTAAVTIVNSILFGNRGGPQLSGTSTVTYSCVQGGAVGSGNIVTPPAFWNAGGSGCADLAITSSSPCIDQGTGAGENCFPPAYPGPACDMGYLGGSGACAWQHTPAPLSLQSIPDCTRTPAYASFAVRGLTARGPVIVVLTHYNMNIPVAAPLLLTGGLACSRGDWLGELPIPAITPGLDSVQLVAATLVSGSLFLTPSMTLSFR